MPHPVDIHVGKRLKSLRLLRGLTQSDVAKALGLSFQQVQKYELGRNRISASKLYMIAGKLGVQVAYLFEGLDDTGDGGPVIEAETAQMAGKIARIADPAHRSRIMGFVDAILDLQQGAEAAA
jgi:transcriptional regulator with XRE-family HTH domain